MTRIYYKGNTKPQTGILIPIIFGYKIGQMYKNFIFIEENIE